MKLKYVNLSRSSEREEGKWKEIKEDVFVGGGGARILWTAVEMLRC